MAHGGDGDDPAALLVVEAAVVVESTALASMKGGSGTEQPQQLVDIELGRLLGILDRAALAHNLGMAQSAAAAAAAAVASGATGTPRHGGPSPNLGHGGGEEPRVEEDDDPLPSHRRSAALYKLCHALVSAGRVRGARLVGSPGAAAAGATTCIGSPCRAGGAPPPGPPPRPLCPELGAAQSLLAAAEVLALRSDVDGTIRCHEEMVSFLLGVDDDDDDDDDDENEVEEKEGGDGSQRGDDNKGRRGDLSKDVGVGPDDEEDRNSLLDDDGTAGGSERGEANGAPAPAPTTVPGPSPASSSSSSSAAAAAPLFFAAMNEHRRMRLISNSLNALGQLYARRGDEEDAIGSFADALDLLRSIEDPVGVVEHDRRIDIRDDVARTLLSLSALRGRRGELDEAIDCGEEALDVLVERHGDADDDDSKAEKGGGGSSNHRHPAVLSALHALGRLYDRDGDFDAAMSCYEDAFLGRCKTVGSDDICVADVLVDMSSALQRSGNNVDGALELNSQALRIYRLLLSHGANTTSNGGTQQQQQQQQQQRCKICLAGTLQNRGSMYMEKNDHDEALNCFADAMEHLKNAKGEDHPDVAGLWAVMGDANVVGERFDCAKDCYAAALEAHRMRGLQDTDSPIVWMLQKIRVIEDIVASAHKEDDEFIDDLATRAEGTISDQMKGAAATEKADIDFREDLATNAQREPEESSQQRAKRLLAQEQEDDRFMREIDAVAPQNSRLAVPNENEQSSSFLQEEQAFLAELASGTMSDDDDNNPDTLNVVKPMSSTELEKARQQMHPPQRQSTEPVGELESIVGPAGIKEIIPQASADDTVSLITFKEEALLSNAGKGRLGSYQRQNVRRTRSSSGGKPRNADWLTNTLGNIVEQADNFLRPLAEHPQQPQEGSGKTKGQVPISEITFTIGGDGQEIARTRSADSDITDIMDLHGISPTSGKPRVPGQTLEEEIGEEIGVEVDELLAQMASTEEDVASPTASGGQPLQQGRPREGHISVSSPSGVGAKQIQVSPISGISRKVVKTAEIKATKKELKRLKVTTGTESAEVAACLMSLGSLFMNEGDIDSALNMWTQELDVRRTVYGAGHYLTADVLNRVGVIRLEKDEFELVSDLLVIDMP